MATVYTKHQAIGRAVERAMQDADSFCVYQHKNYPDEYIVQTRASSSPRNFKRIFTQKVTLLTRQPCTQLREAHMRNMIINSHTYLTTTDGQTWRLYRLSGQWVLVAVFSGTETQARERAVDVTWADRREMDDAFRARDLTLRSINGLGVNDWR